MAPNESGPIIQHAIQLAIAPVFLLTGIASLLGVMANRLARIIDRARALEQRWASLDEKARQAARVEVARSRAPPPFRELVDQFLHRRGAAGVHRHLHALLRGVLPDRPQVARGRTCSSV